MSSKYINETIKFINDLDIKGSTSVYYPTWLVYWIYVKYKKAKNTRQMMGKRTLTRILKELGFDYRQLEGRNRIVQSVLYIDGDVFNIEQEELEAAKSLMWVGYSNFSHMRKKWQKRKRTKPKVRQQVKEEIDNIQDLIRSATQE